MGRSIPSVIASLIVVGSMVSALPARADTTVGAGQTLTVSSNYQGNITLSTGATLVVNNGAVVTGNVQAMAANTTVTISGATVTGDVQTNGATSLTITSGTIGGNVQPQNTGSVNVMTSTVSGNVQPQGGGAVSVICSTVKGNLQAQSTGAVTFSGDTVNGNVAAQSTTGGVQILDNTVTGNLQVQNNSGTVSATGSAVQGNVLVQSNIGGPTTVSGNTGHNLQCKSNSNLVTCTGVSKVTQTSGSLCSAKTVGGSLSGLISGTLTLQDNAGDNLPLTANGSFTFAQPVAYLSAYSVTIASQPAGQTCSVKNGSGTMGASPITNVAVSCVPNDYELGGSVSGMLGGTLVLEDIDGNIVDVTASGSFDFSSEVAFNTAYEITIVSQPIGQTCTVNNGDGTVGAGNVSTISIACVPNTYPVGGTLSGLINGTLELLDNGGDTLSLTGNGSFTFATPVAYLSAYSVTIASQPVGQTCALTGDSGTMGAGPITGVAVTCVPNTYAVGGTLSGLISDQLTLQDNGGDDLIVAANGSFTFASAVAYNSAYAITITSQPIGQTCAVTSGTDSGTMGAADVTSVAVTCVPNTYAVGGTLSGLLDGSVTLQDNGGDDLTLSSNGAFTFATPVAFASGYNVTISSQPDGQTCTVTDGTGSGTMGAAPVGTVSVTCTPNSYTVGGSLSGLISGTVVLQDNDGDSLPITGNGAFTFATAIAHDSGYSVTVASQPDGQTCTVSSGSGTMGDAAVTNVAVTCAPNPYAVGGMLGGLINGTLTLQDNGSDTLTLSANGTFSFPTPVLFNSSYNVAIVAQPVGQTCAVLNGSGTVGAGPVTSVTVACVPNTYAVGGTISGLINDTLVLQDNGGDTLALTGNGTFAFSTPVAYNSPYAVTIAAQPAGQTCAVANGGGTMGAGPVTNVAITCKPNLYAIGGTLSGLMSGTVTLEDNGGDALTLSTNGAFAFDQQIAYASQYAVSVATQPVGQTCVVGQGSGTVGPGNVSSISVTCTPNLYAGDGTLTGLISGTLVLQENGDNLSVSANGSFTFPTEVAFGSAYSVSIVTQPAGQTCTLANNAGLVGAGPFDVQVSCSPNPYYVSGTLSGLIDGTVVLQDNGGDNVTVNSNGSFAFATPIAFNSTYAVSVASQPAGQTCVVSHDASGTIGAANVTDVAVTCTPISYTVGGTLSGLINGSVTLTDNGGDNLALSANGSFTFATSVAYNSAYLVTVSSQPEGQTCAVAGGSGKMGAGNVASVSVTCTPNTYAVGGTLSGLINGTLTLQDNGGDALALTANGSFAFAKQVAFHSTYAVTISSQPVGQTCAVSNGSGTMGTGAVTSVSVSCTPKTYSVGGTLSGLFGGDSITLTNGADSLTLSANGSFTFATAVAFNSGYSVTIASQPVGETCTVTNGSGTMGAANVTSVSVACTLNKYPVTASGDGHETWTPGGPNCLPAPLAWYRLGDESSGVAADSSGNGNNGTYSGGVSDVAGVTADGALGLNGSNAYMQTTVPLGQAFSVSTWARSGTAAWNTFGWVTSARGPNGFIFHPWQGERRIGIYMVSQSADDYTLVAEASPADITQWHQYALTYDGTTATAYVDGVAIGSIPYASNLRHATEPVTIYYGEDDPNFDSGRFGNGAIAEPTVYSTGLSAAEIAGLYASKGLPGTSEGVQTVCSVNYESTQSFTVTAATGYTVSQSVGGTCPAGSWSGNTYTTSGIAGDCTVSFSATLNTYQVSSSGDGHETWAPTGSETINYGSTASYTVTANTGYTTSAAVGGTCPAGSWSENVYTTGAITGNCTVSFAATANSYTVGGTISGLLTSNTLELLLNGSNAVFSSGPASFTFGMAVAYGTPYSVTVPQQPTGQTCTVTNGSGTMGAANVTNVAVNCTLNSYAVSASGDNGETWTPSGTQSVSYLSTQSFTVTASTGYTLSSTVGGTCPAGNWSGSTYTTGRITGDCSVSFAASVNSYTVGGTISGLLTSNTLELLLNGSNAVFSSGPASFTFGMAVAYGTPYSVTVPQQPTGQTCTVTNGSGTMGAANVTNVAVACVRNTYQVTASGDGHESWSPSGTQSVTYLSTQTFSVTANSGYRLTHTAGGNCPAGSWAGDVYTTGAITGNCSVSFSAQPTYQVTASGDNGETWTPTGTQTVLVGQTASFTVTANAGYTLSQAVGGNCPAGSWSSNVYTTGTLQNYSVVGTDLDCDPVQQPIAGRSEPDVTSCYQFCSQTTGCNYFTYYVTASWCNLNSACGPYGSPQNTSGTLYKMNAANACTVTFSAPPNLPGAPTGVQATAGNASATVTWTAPAGAIGITSYTVTPYLGSTAQTPVTVTTTSATLAGLTNGATYTFTVAATNSTGTGPASTPSSSVLVSACLGPNPVVCSASDQCHVAGVCDPATGVCSNPAATDGTACNDGNVCTSGDVCSAGTCVGGPTCQNGATCTAGATASCSCTAGYTGSTCSSVCSAPAACNAPVSGDTVHLIPAFEFYPGSVYDSAFTHSYADAHGTVTWTSTGCSLSVDGVAPGTSLTAYSDLDGATRDQASTAGPFATLGSFTIDSCGHGTFSCPGSVSQSSSIVINVTNAGTILISDDFNASSSPASTSGVCAPTCGAGQTACGASCETLTSDVNNCGGCGDVCSTNDGTPTCQAGLCGCYPPDATPANTAFLTFGQPGYPDCTAFFSLDPATGVTTELRDQGCAPVNGNQNVRLVFYPQTKYSNGVTCDPGAITSTTYTQVDSSYTWPGPNKTNGPYVNNGESYYVCIYTHPTVVPTPCPACASGQTVCNQACSDEQTDPNNCGGCGHVCSTGVCSAGVCATAPAAPAAPTVSASNTAVTVSWTAPANGGSPITNYTVTPYMGSTALTPMIVNTTTATVTGLTNGTSYTFTVFATNAVGNGLPSPHSNAVTPEPSCSVGQSLCQNQCTVLANDPNNCGACGNVCTNGQVCQAGVCSSAFSASRIAVGAESSCSLRPSGNVYCWGVNQYGQLGNGTTTNSTTPVQVSGLTGASSIFAASFSTCAVLQSGGVKCWGDNNNGQLGDGTTTSRSSPVAVSGLTNAVAISGSCSPSSGNCFTCAVQSSGNVRCWGDNAYGQLGTGNTTSSKTPVQVAGLNNAIAVATTAAPSGMFACAIQQGGSVVCWGSSDGESSTSNLTPAAITGVSGVVGITGMYGGMCVVTSSQQVLCWGSTNAEGQLGNGTTSASATPEVIVSSGATAIAGDMGSYATTVCAAEVNGGALCWGENGEGETGDGNTITPDRTPSAVSGPNTAIQTAVGGGAGTGRGNACSLLSDNSVKCWGDNSGGELGTGNTTSSDLPVSVINLGN